MDPDSVEAILTLVEDAITLLNQPAPDTRRALTALYAAMAKGEPWRTLRHDIRNNSS